MSNLAYGESFAYELIAPAVAHSATAKVDKTTAVLIISSLSSTQVSL
jgi:hypothetical protein